MKFVEWCAYSWHKCNEQCDSKCRKKKRIHHAQKYQTIQFNVILYVYMRALRSEPHSLSERDVYCICIFDVVVVIVVIAVYHHCQRVFLDNAFSTFIARLSFSHLFARCIFLIELGCRDVCTPYMYVLVTHTYFF